MADVKISYGGALIAEINNEETKTLHTSGKYCEGNIQIAYIPRSGGPELPELENPGAAEDLMDGKQLIDGAGRIVEGTFTLDAEVAEQDSLIEQIQTAIQNKMVGDAPVIEALEIATNGVYTAPEGVDGYSPITVNVPVPEGYIQPTGTLEITENGEHDVAAYAAVSVNVAESGGGESTQNLLDATLDGTLTAINSNVNKIIAYACYGITTIKTVDLPNCTGIGGYAFRGCSGITTFSAPKVTAISSYAFYGCSNLLEISFQNISNVPGTCFYQCTKLKKADFGTKMKTLNGSSLAYCNALNTLILRYTDGVVSIATNTFSGANFDGYVYVPAALLADYEANSSWGSYAASAKFRAIEDYPDVCG